ncbi:MAG: hypothetical protein ACRD03_02840 [Acidimicrobiales bacterium]
MKEREAIAIVRVLVPSLTGVERVAVAVHLGVDPGTVGKWRRGERLLNERMADRVATRLGAHPCQLWPDWFEGAA